MGIRNTFISVLGNKRKRNLTEEYLRKELVTFQTYWNTDWEMDLDKSTFHPDHRKFTDNTEADYRCFRGHTEMAKELLEHTRFPYYLILEDDAKPQEGWQRIVENSIDLLNQYEIVSLHARAIRMRKNMFDYKEHPYVQPGPDRTYSTEINWTNGTLAYLIRRDALSRLAFTQYTGVPIDLWLATHYIFCAIQPDTVCFVHENKYGSFYDRVSTTEPIQ